MRGVTSAHYHEYNKGYFLDGARTNRDLYKRETDRVPMMPASTLWVDMEFCARGKRKAKEATGNNKRQWVLIFCDPTLPLAEIPSG